MNPVTNSESSTAPRSRDRKKRLGARERAVEAFRREVQAATDPNAADDYGEPWLHRALFRADADAVDILLERGADLNHTNGRGWTPLHVAVIRNDARHVNMLLDRGTDARTADKRGVTPLHRARSRSVAKLLLDHGADPNARDVSGRTAVEREPVAGVLFERGLEDLKRAELGGRGVADRPGRLREIQTLVDLGLAPDRSGKRGDTLLHRAARRGDARLSELLLAHGANPNARNDADDVPLHSASSAGVVRLLLEHGADPNAEDDYGDVPLHSASSARIVRLLLEHGADAEARNGDGETPLHKIEAADSVRLLLEHGADPNAQDDDGNVPLHEACSRLRDADTVRFLLEHGANPNARANDGQVPLHNAYYADTARILLQYGADMEARDNNGKVPLHTAGEEATRLLLEHGADPNVRDNHGAVPLRGARNFGFPKKMRALLEHGADPSYVALCMECITDTMRVILEHGADPNARDDDDRWPLHSAFRLESVRLLLEHGADPDVANPAGVTASKKLVKWPDAAVLLLNNGPGPAASNDGWRALLNAVLERYGDPGATAELRDNIPLVGLEGRLQAGHIPEGAGQVVVTVRLARAQCRSGVRKWLQVHVPDVDPNDLDFGMPVAEVMRLANGADKPSAWARHAATAIRLAYALARARRVIVD